jgi:peptidoglycan hydrolase-like protein with peptidoglycan-binding domain
VPDGFPGIKTQAAIRQYQATQQLPQDGFAGPSLYQRLSAQ